MKKITLYIATMLLLVACGPTLKVTHDVNSNADFSKFKTFALYNPTGDESPISEMNRNRVKSAIIATMMAKGYTEADTTTADLLVNPVAITKEGKSVTANTDYYGYGGFYRPYYWGGMGMMSSNTTFSVDNYIDGSLIIDVIDRGKRELIWEGVGNSEIDGPIKDPDTKIPKAINKIMATLPPAK